MSDDKPNEKQYPRQTMRPIECDEIVIDKSRFRFKSETENELILERRRELEVKP